MGTRRSAAEVAMQRSYYAKTAETYDALHGAVDNEHRIALSFLGGMIDDLECQSVLDIGSGTGRVLMFLKERKPEMTVLGVEPVEELRRIGHSKGLQDHELVSGDACELQLPNDSFDLVCCFGVLHHIRTPEVVISEMLRVASKAIFVSDANNFGQGSLVARYTKQTLRALGLWGVVNLLKTRGKGYTFTAGDGVAYSYSVFTNFRQIAENCQSVHVLNTKGDGRCAYRAAGHVAVLGIKEPA